MCDGCSGKSAHVIVTSREFNLQGLLSYIVIVIVMSSPMLILFLVLAISGVTNAFSPTRAVGMRSRSAARLSMAEEPMDFEDPKLFDMNKRVRLGRSRDQDGKSNIWSIEPRMEVAGEEAGGAKKNLAIVGAVILAAVISLPLFTAFSTLVPDPTDF